MKTQQAKIELPLPLQSPGLSRRIYRKLIREAKRAFGVPSYLRTEDRQVLEQVIIPYFAQDAQCQGILFVGCAWFTEGYNQWFDNKRDFWTLDPLQSQRRFGSKKHRVGHLENIKDYFESCSLDLILCNGVFGWGLNTRPAAEQAFGGCYNCLRDGGIFVLGWNDVDPYRPFYPSECEHLRLFKPFIFPPLGAAEFSTASRHVYNFYVKAESSIP